MNIKAFNHGFTEKCAQLGINASDLVKFAYKRQKLPNNVPVAAAGGAVLGVILGALKKAKDKKERLRNMALFGVSGGAIGAGGGYLNDAVRDTIRDLMAAQLASGAQASSGYSMWDALDNANYALDAHRTFSK